MQTVKPINKPINVGLADLLKFRFPITAIASIGHRISGVVLFAFMLGMLYVLQMSLASEESFNEVKALLLSGWPKFFLWAVLSALVYHFVAGIKHLIMDWGFGETLEGGRQLAILTLVVSILSILALGIWLLGVGA